MTVPHNFPSLTSPDTRFPPILLVGAGFSKDIVPDPCELIEGILSRKDEIEKNLGISTSTLSDKDANTLYTWADEVLEDLKKHGIEAGEAKLKLVRVMNLDTNPLFHGDIKVNLMYQSKKHRVVARFAKEGQFTSAWSLNWDCLLEKCFEAVGLKAYDEGVSSKQLPWKQYYKSWVPNQGILPKPDQDDKTFHIIKPHGCVRKLKNGESKELMIAESELQDPLNSAVANPHDSNSLNLFQRHFCGSPFIACGWSASEKYLEKRFEKEGEADRLNIDPSVDDSFSVINRSWYHNTIASAYGRDKRNSFFEVAKPNSPTFDTLFLWIQTIYGMNILKRWIDSPVFDDVMASIKEPTSDYWAINWFDYFLPIWARVCFLTKSTKFFMNGAIDTVSVPSDNRDEHIPWGCSATDGKYLKWAAKFFEAIHQSGGNHWDFESFPGALWDKNKSRLVVILPRLYNEEGLSLNALKPLFESRHWDKMGLVSSIDLLLLDDSGIITPDAPTELKVRQDIAITLGGKWSRPAKFGVCTTLDEGV